MPRYGVWFKGRNTAVVVTASNRSQAISRAYKKKKRPKGRPAVVSARLLNAKERKQDRNRKWISTRSDGKSKAKSRVGHGRGQGPPRRKKRRG